MIGKLAASCGFQLPLQVLQSAAGFYLGTSELGMPISRESVEYWPSADAAADALSNGKWTQKRICSHADGLQPSAEATAPRSRGRTL